MVGRELTVESPQYMMVRRPLPDGERFYTKKQGETTPEERRLALYMYSALFILSVSLFVF